MPPKQFPEKENKRKDDLEHENITHTINLDIELNERKEEMATLEDKELEQRYQYMKSLELKIDTEIGYRFWNRYVSAAFWSNISLPINLSITMLTALSTGQATTENLLPRQLYVNISIATLVISTLNTYFRPHLQMNKNIELMNKWNVFGCEFEEMYYSEKNNLFQVNERIHGYEDLIHRIHELKKNENMEGFNTMTDIIYCLLRMCKCFIKNKSRWLAMDESLRAIYSSPYTPISYGSNSNKMSSFRIQNESHNKSPKMGEYLTQKPLQMFHIYPQREEHSHNKMPPTYQENKKDSSLSSENKPSYKYIVGRL